MVQGSTAQNSHSITNNNERTHDNGGADRNSDTDRRERIQRYKEERRKQMAARYGSSADLSSSDEEKVSSNSVGMARRRKRVKPGAESSSTEISTVENNKILKLKSRQHRKTSEGDISKSSKESDNFAKSRISSQNNNKRVESRIDDSVYQVKRRITPVEPLHSVLQESKEVCNTGGADDEKVTRRRNSAGKDKSHKRKSNLNRAPSQEPTAEAAVATDDSIRRRRRRSDNILATYTPELTSVHLVASVSSSSSCQSVSALRMSEGSSGSELKARKRLSYDIDEIKPISSKARDGKGHTNRQSLKKPDIPETLRTKEIRTHQRTAQLQDRPPAVPETVKNSPNGIKPQRKLQDYSSCFMVNQREHENTSKDNKIFSTEHGSGNEHPINNHIDNLTAQAKNLIARVENMSNVSDVGNSPEGESANLQEYKVRSNPSRRSIDFNLSRDNREGFNVNADSSVKKSTEIINSRRLVFRDVPSTNDQTNGHLSAACPVQSVSFEDEQLSDTDPSRPSRRSRMDCVPSLEHKTDHISSQKGSRGSSLDSDSPRVNSPETHSILKRKSSREEQWSSLDRALTPEPQSILKKKSTSRTSSSDNLDCEPRPILKKKNSIEDIEHGEQKPRPILKKKSLTDDELDPGYVAPRSILKGARSREDLIRADGVISPASILKRFSKSELDYEGDLKPILKRRQTTDGVRRIVNTSDSENEYTSRVRSDSAPDAVALPIRSNSSNRVIPRHGILKNSRNNCSNTSDDIELSLPLSSRRVSADDFFSDSIRVDATNRPVSPSLGFLTARQSGSDRPLSVAERIAGMEALKLPNAETADCSSNINETTSISNYQERNSAYVDNYSNSSSFLQSFNNSSKLDDSSFRMPSRVSQRAAFFSQLENNGTNDPKTSEDSSRKARGARFATQPVTDMEVNEAARMVDSSCEANTERYGSLDTIPKQPRIVKDGKDKQEVPKSILKSEFIRKLSNDDHLKSILKNDSPLSSSVTSPEYETHPLKSVLKKESSVDDNKEIKSILKRQSESLEPDTSSDSSSDPIKEFDKGTTFDVKCAKNRKPLMVKDNWAEALRKMGPTRSSESKTDRNNEPIVRRTTESENETRTFDSVPFRLDELLNERTAFEEEALIFGESKPWKFKEMPKTREHVISIAEATNSQLVYAQKDTTYESNDSYEDVSCGNVSPIWDKLSASEDEDDRVQLRNKTKTENYERLAETTSHEASTIVAEDDAREIISKEGVQSNAQRLEALEKDIKLGWQTRIRQGLESTVDTDGSSQRKARPRSLLERVNQLETSSMQWKNRVEQSDATQFTVAHRMTSSSTTSVPNAVLKGPPRSPSVERVRRTPRPKVFKSKTGGNIPDLLGSVRKELFARSQSQPNDSKNEPTGNLVSVPNPDDDDFNAFFSKSSAMKMDRVDVDIASFDYVVRESTQLLANRRNVKVTRRHQSSINPLRTLAGRRDLKAEYTEVKLGVGDEELRRMKVEEISKSSSFAMEALAGLASKENFNAISLKKVEENPITRDMPTFLNLMLIQVKGRRHAQVKLVAPIETSINEGDDFILITPQEVFHYKGEFSNVIERAVCSEILSYILQTKDMGVNQNCRAVEITTKSTSNALTSFWRNLGGNSLSKATAAGEPDEDDSFETSIVSSTKVYEVTADSLVPVKEAWGQSPKYELLSSDKILVFDFGSEVYLWAGKFACSELRKNGSHLLKELWQEEFDYSDCDINPVSMKLKDEFVAMSGKRPEWGICGKITENVETILFKEKFVDWPDTAQKSRRMEVEKELTNKHDPVSELSPCDATSMINDEPSSPDLVLEMSHLGRGVKFYDEEERRLLSISTNDVKVWEISENEKNCVDEKSFGHFYAGETYVVRWYYNITATGRTLKGTPSKHNMTGRTRVAYFFWQGSGSSISDKGVSALMTVELDEERGPHIRVPMGSESPAFLNLFNGRLVYHSGKSDLARREKCRMFLVRGNQENEAHLIEINVSAKHLRSKTCLVIVDDRKGILYLWVGAKSLRHIRKIASHAANNLAASSAPEMKWKIVPANISEQHEGNESTSFLHLFDFETLSTAYFSLLNHQAANCTSRFWRFEAIRGKFEANEIVSKYRSPVVTPFPIMQEELYDTVQPGLVLVDSGDKVWIWQGWWPDIMSDSDSSRASTGSARLRFTFARRAAFQTALNYVKEKSLRNLEERTNPEPQLVIAGMEPLEFCNLFPVWENNLEIEHLQEKEGRYTVGKQYSVRETLQELSKTRYTLDELTRFPRPDGIDQLHLEKYLSDDEFETSFGTDRASFYSLPEWKQVDIKKKTNLF